jgi:mRNA-degrading endonuclease RelE of RelBE toxin-antitoxin system
MGYTIEIVEAAKEEIRSLKATDRAMVIAAIRKHLTTAPDVEGRSKKVLRGLVPPWTQVRPVWQLTVMPFRVFYDVEPDGRVVIIQAVREKSGRKTTEEIL